MKSPGTVGASIGRNVAWAFAGNAGYAFCQWGLLAVMAKVGSAEALGLFAFGLAFSAPAMVLANLHLRAVQATDAAEAFPFGVYLGLRLLTTAAMFAAIAATAIAFGYDGNGLRTILALALAKGVEAVSDVIFGRLQYAERMRRIALSMLAKGVGSVAAVGAVLWATGSVAAASFALAVVWAGTLLAIDLPGVAGLTAVRPRLDWHRTPRLAWLALPLGGVMALTSLTVNVPRYAVQTSLGPAGLGHFAAMGYLLAAASQVVIALGAAATPRLAREYTADRHAYRALVHRCLGVAIALGLVLLAGVSTFGATILATLYAPEYAVSAGAFVWMALASAVGFVASVLGFAITAARRFHGQLAVAVLALGAAFASATLLVPLYGIVGAAWAVLTTEAARMIGLAFVYVRVQHVGALAWGAPSLPAGGRVRIELGAR